MEARYKDLGSSEIGMRQKGIHKMWGALEKEQMTDTIKFLSFPLILGSCITGAIFAWLALVIVTFIGIPWAVWKVMRDIYNKDNRDNQNNK